MGLSVHQISPKPLQVDSWNSHIVNLLPRQRSNSFQNLFYCPFYKLYQKQFSQSALTRSANGPRHFIRLTPFPASVTQPRVRVKCCRYRLHVAITQSGWPRPEPRVRVKQFSQSSFSSTTAAFGRTVAYCVLVHCALQWNSTFRLDSFRRQSHSAFL